MPTIAVSGAGLVGTTYAVSDGGVGNWQSYIDGQWTNIPGAATSTYTKGGDAYEHPALRWRGSDGRASAAQPAYWSPLNLPADEAVLRWLDGLSMEGRTAVDGRISAIIDRVNGLSYTELAAGNGPTNTAPLDFTGYRRLEVPGFSSPQHTWFLNALAADIAAAQSTDGAVIYYAGTSGNTNGDRKPMFNYSRANRTIATNWLSTTGNGSVNHVYPDFNPHTVVSRVIGGVVYSSFDGETEKNSGATTVSPQRAGTSGRIGGYSSGPPPFKVYSHIMGRGALSPASVELLQGWSAHRHGHPLPAGHRYAASAPTVAGPVEPIVGAASATLAALTAIGAALLAITGAGDGKLAPLSSAAAASLGITAQASGTLAPLTASTAGALSIEGQAGGALAPIDAEASGKLAIDGQLSASLAPLTGSSAARGEQANTGQAAGQLSPVALSATGRLDVTGLAGVTLGPLVATATGVSEGDYDAPPRATAIVPSRQFDAVVPAQRFSAVVLPRRFAASVPARNLTAEVQA